MIRIKRVYEPASKDDGFRILVDRLWPRGLTKRRAHVDLWMKEIAPSNTLRKWFGHDPARWPEFVRRYRAELAANKLQVNTLKQLLRQHRQATLLFGAKDEEHNQAVALAILLKRKR
jgi:uncharacterized protein YeaO (DUF488 family)